MKHIVWALALSLIVAACGKTNTTSSASGNSISSNPSTTTTTSTVSDFATFKTRVNNGDFAYPTYSYVNVYLKSFTTEVEKKKFLGIPYSYSNTNYSNMSRVDNRVSGSVTFSHELGTNLTAVKAALANLVNNATGTPATCGQACWAFISGSKTYMIDLNSPMVANPVASYDSTNAGYSMLYWSGMP